MPTRRLSRTDTISCWPVIGSPIFSAAAPGGTGAGQHAGTVAVIAGHCTGRSHLRRPPCRGSAGSSAVRNHRGAPAPRGPGTGARHVAHRGCRRTSIPGPRDRVCLRRAKFPNHVQHPGAQGPGASTGVGVFGNGNANAVLNPGHCSGEQAQDQSRHPNEAFPSRFFDLKYIKFNKI